MENFITILDSRFLPQGIALYKSMLRNMGDFRLWVVCVDEEAYSILSKLEFENIKPLSPKDYESEELLKIKQERSVAEYCWTLTPLSAGFVFSYDPTARRATYIDADIWFHKSPKPIFKQFEKSSGEVMITDHGFAPQYDQTEESGAYCVQFLIFNNSDTSKKVRDSWTNKCIESCSSISSDGKFGDQMYLNDWENVFGDAIFIMQNEEWAQAPWNSIRFPYGKCIFYHFQGFRLTSEVRYKIPYYAIPPAAFNGIYKKYFADIANALIELKLAGWVFKPQAQHVNISRYQFIKDFIKRFYKHSWRFAPHTSGELKN